ncbi:MAG TPA: phosphomethylpyrimidine synthase ThiC, partial [Flavobacteriales bacterium]|nr:phosphomethylpyrimidine synthase ThiC [Flavobacteriales bacterium]
MAKKETIPSEQSKITRDPFPASRKVYANGTIHSDVHVGMREISLTDSKPMFVDGEFKKLSNPPITVYDTSGPYTDPEVNIDVKVG